MVPISAIASIPSACDFSTTSPKSTSSFSVAVVRIREPKFREEKSFVKFLEAAVERSGTPQTFAAEGLARYPLHRNYFVAKQRV